MRIAGAALMLFMTAGAVAQQAPGPVASTFMVFFDWGKGEIRSDDAATLDKVAEAYRANPALRLKLSGHTDRSGSVATNRRTGLSRAELVRSELEKRGISRNAITVASFGEEQPLVPTEDGVREVQNRRVVIEFGE
ncbi:OmpA family protein [Sphingomonas sp. NSE70-1]|uniref:OmpA family protein n=1 Tax=Sphingomonas caseinilyticus TaxID=2908205 RepID=A0ABT0RXN4_9SPHN|nr:OmpA family protein [Sphingomonas caseinilyticus]MCL6699593.1 OmpA family protein [Sphingomonas caseinilyticus]